MTASPPFVGSFAIVRKGIAQHAQWLTLWDDTRGAYRFVEARRGASESFRSCLTEAIEDELELTPRDYVLSSHSLVHHQAPIEWQNEDRPSWVAVEFFPVDLYGAQAEEKICALDHSRWWSMEELAVGRASNGTTFCERQYQLLLRADILPPWI